ncbi:hypothetical protein BS47DRAFT_1354820 [Hydnum rufescens UP504]|uniref:Uncharacterized protein n=1 Tax=Hydnum rufescens UP504 TaxID=1448309 RepID=A0A9P6AFG1_9AGAM|nr:hypothetical protein BS47DRAFT_1354820 [Hydnum rufescens UP504]
MPFWRRRSGAFDSNFIGPSQRRFPGFLILHVFVARRWWLGNVHGVSHLCLLSYLSPRFPISTPLDSSCAFAPPGMWLCCPCTMAITRN